MADTDSAKQNTSQSITTQVTHRVDHVLTPPIKVLQSENVDKLGDNYLHTLIKYFE